MNLKSENTHQKLSFVGDAELALVKLRAALTSDPIVAYPRLDRQYALIVDASTGTATTPGGMGFILAQMDEQQNFHVISYGSRELVDAENNYSPFLLEMQAAVEVMKHYDNNLRGRKFVLYTDHKPLKKLSHLHTKTLN